MENNTEVNVKSSKELLEDLDRLIEEEIARLSQLNVSSIHEAKIPTFEEPLEENLEVITQKEDEIFTDLFGE
jgi:hypothetical protein